MASQGVRTKVAKSVSKPSTPDTRPFSQPSTLDPLHVLLVLIPIVAAIVVYAPAARNGFVWDDPLVLQQLEHFHSVGDLLVPPAVVPKFYYRPLTFLTFLIDQAFGGSNPWLFHVTVIVWHLAASALVFALALRLLGAAHRVEASVAALVFAVHPVHVESVAWIAGRSDVIATVFVLLAVYLGGQVRRPWTAWAAALALLLGCWAKEVALAALVLIPARDLCVDRTFYARRYVPLGLATATYFGMRYAGIGSVGGGLPSEAVAAELVRDVIAASGWYAVKTLVPIHLNAYVPRIPAGPAYALVGLAVLAVAAVATVSGWRRNWSIAVFAFAWWFIGLVPSLMVIIRRSASAVLAERYAYLPSVGAVLLLGWLLTRVSSATQRRIATAVVVVLALVGVVHARQRISVWSDNLSFWSDVVNKVPDESLPHRELADALMAQNRLDEAEPHYQAALTTHSDREGRVMAFNNLGNLYMRRKRYDDAEAAYKNGVDLYPHPKLFGGLGRLAIERAREAKSDAEAVRQLQVAQNVLTRAVAGDPQDYRSQNLLGQVLFNMGKREEAKQLFEASLRIQPTGPIADIARNYLAQIGS
jgi:Flp pilus assembly protein TadD